MHVVPPIPSDSLLGGNAKSFGRDGLAFYEMCERMGPIVRGRAYAHKFYIVTGPELIEEILVKKARAFHKPGLLKGLHLVFGDGLLTSDGDVWRHRRRTLQPVFHGRRQPEYGAQMREGIADHLARWRDGTVDVHAASIELLISNLTRTLFGVDDAELSREIDALTCLCHEITQAGMSFSFPYYGLLAAFPPLARLPFGRRLDRLERSILERLARLRANVARDDFYQRLVHGTDVDGCPMGRTAIRDEVITMIIAGHETAASATSWALVLLAQHRDVRERLVAELDAVCGDRLPEPADLERLPLLDKVLVETYRLYPPTHRIGRTVVEPVTIGGFELDVGAEVVIPQWAVHRSAKHYEAPLEFRPSRWTDAFIDGLPRHAYFPFSGGPRVCIGQAFVTLELSLLVGAIVKTFDYALAPGTRVTPTEGLTLLPGDGTLRIDVRRRVPAVREGMRPPPSALSSHRLLAANAEEGD